MEIKKLISADDHLIEPRHIWQERLPKKYLEDGPRVIEEGGVEYWMYEGQRMPTVGLYATAGKKPEEFNMDPLRYEDMPEACYDPAARVRAMDEDGVRASLCFPTFPRTCGQTFFEGKDRELADICVKAYNDYIIEEWAGTAPGRLIPMVIGQIWDPKAMAAEIERCAAKGAKALTFSESPNKLGKGLDYVGKPWPMAEDWTGAFNGIDMSADSVGLPSLYTTYWDPVWQVCQDTDIAICLHIGSSSTVPRTAPDAPFLTTLALSPQNAHQAATDLMFAPFLRRFPNLKVVLSESAIGWVPFALEYADYAWGRHRFYANTHNLSNDVMPSDVFRRNVWVCVIDEHVGIEMRDKIGVDNIMWECDYPHSDSSYPNSLKAMSETLKDVPQDQVDKITHQNAENVFNLT